MTEKSVLLRTRIQNFMGIFLDAEEKNFDQGKEIVNEWESIIKELNVIQKIEHSEAFNMITSLTERPRTNYNAAINVAAYASLFAQVLDVPEAKWKNICLGGLLHNIGIARLPIHIAKTLPSLLSPEDLEFYKKYPTLGINLVKSKKVPIDPAVVNIVEQHAENCDGSGFPKGMRAVSICEEARIIAIAIAFNNLTSLTDESEAHTPMRAINMIAESNNPMKGSSILDFTMIKKIQSFFITQSKKLDSSFEDPGA